MRYLFVFNTLFLFLVGCSTIEPVRHSGDRFDHSGIFTHDAFENVLQRFVDGQGFIDYASLKKDPEEIEKYYFLVSTYSPQNNPALFSSKESRLAYWINAYNAAVIKAVLTHYPISSVRDVKPPFLLFLLPEETGFFVFQRLIFGGKKISLFSMEKDIIRKGFHDPRVHFALNCASRGCPRLPRQVFTAEELHDQLDREARRYISEDRNVKIDHKNKIIFISSIFKWYKSDFLEWYQAMFPDKEATLSNYMALYAPKQKVEDLKKGASYPIEFLPYDWRLNDQSIE